MIWECIVRVVQLFSRWTRTRTYSDASGSLVIITIEREILQEGKWVKL